MSGTFTFWMTTILERLRRAIVHTPHKEGVNRWHASFFEKALERVVTPGTVVDNDILQMLNLTIPGDLLDVISWDLPAWESSETI
ncbi:hypothetical protein QFC19_005834 [Naganishia cerealis]|uniref:Uncharacterized protein n=1 Tax=Naganishia cerealis TaxID=610337 RepID=A0ACC2VN24_9TREE|nr:hypothetical protein QFC19_005834 [Naganishia cerealis]